MFEIIEKTTFVIFGLSERRSHTAESVLYSLAYEIYNDEIKLTDIANKLKELIDIYAYGIEDALTDKDANYYWWDYLKYFLFEYEIWRCSEVSSGKPSATWEQLKRTDLSESIEHILPQTYPSKVPYWTSRFSTDKHRNNFSRIGNLTLTDQNLDLGNKGFDKKKELYKNSSWQIERDLTKYTEWTDESISIRESEIVKFAQERWEI